MTETRETVTPAALRKRAGVLRGLGLGDGGKEGRETHKARGGQ